MIMNRKNDFNEFMRYKFGPDRPYQYHIDTSLSFESGDLGDLHDNFCVDFVVGYSRL